MFLKGNDDSSGGEEALHKAVRRLLVALSDNPPAEVYVVPRSAAEMAAALDRLRESLLPAGTGAREQMRARLVGAGELPAIPADLSQFSAAIAGGEIGDPIGLGFAALLELIRGACDIKEAIGPREQALYDYVDMREGDDDTHDEAPRG